MLKTSIIQAAKVVRQQAGYKKYLILLSSLIVSVCLMLVWSGNSHAEPPKESFKTPSDSDLLQSPAPETIPQSPQPNRPDSTEEKPADPHPKLPINRDRTEEKTYFFEHSENTLVNSTLGVLDRLQGWVGSQVDDLGEEADDFFGTDESFDRTRGSRLDIMTPVRFHADGTIDTEIKFRAKVELPRTNQRWNLIVLSADESLRDLATEGETSAGSDPSAGSNSTVSGTSQTDTGGTAIGLRFMLDMKDYTTSFFDFGLNFRNVIEPDPFVRLKGTYKWQLTDQWYSRMTQDLFWENHRGVGLNSRQVFDYQVNQRYLLRSDTNGTWWDKQQNYILSHNVIFFDRVNVHRGLAYHLGWDWETQEIGFHLSGYHAGLNWRERIYKKWLFFEIEPRVDFRQDDNFQRADPSIQFMLEMQFYDRSKRS